MNRNLLQEFFFKKLLSESTDKSEKVALPIITRNYFNYYNDDPSYIKETENFFGTLKTPTKEYGDQVIDELIHIIMEDEGISEKSFSLIDDVVKRTKNWVMLDKENNETVEKCSQDGNRPKLCAELIFSKIKNSKETAQPLFEAKKSKFKKLEDNKIPLTDEERYECFKQDAVWHYNHSINPVNGRKEKKVCAIWKSKDSKGKTVYGCNTHRAYDYAHSLQAAINLYHNKIKGTS